MREGPVRTSRFSDRERDQILREGHDRGREKKVCEQYGISLRTFYRWRARCVQEQAADADRLNALEFENRWLRQKVAELSLEYQSLRAALIADVIYEC